MLFEWDDANIVHVARHAITPDEAEQVLYNDPVELDVVLRYGEMRTVHLGETDDGRVLVVILTERKGLHRVVTARPSRREERAFYSTYKAAER